MTEAPIAEGPLQAGSTLRTPRAAAVAGIVFSVLLISALVLLRISVPAHADVPGEWLTDSWRRTALAIALNLVPFAGIAFLWFVGVVRDRIGAREDRFFAGVSSAPPSAGTLALGRNVTAILLNVYAMRMAAVFTLTTVTIARRTEIVSRWLTVAGLVSALVLLVGVGISPWVELLFPLWILALSIDILAAGLKPPGRAAGPARQG